MHLVLILAILLMSVPALTAEQPETLESLKARAEQTNGSKQIELLAEVAKRQLQVADDAFDAGNADAGVAAAKDATRYAVRAGDTATKTGKRMKPTEIQLRKMARDLTDLARSLEVEQREAVKPLVTQIEATRTNLLTRMFKK